MVAWFLIDNDKLKFDKELCIKYALVHDLVEVYAGDTYFMDKNHALSKQKREKDALKKIKKNFGNFSEMIQILEKYEKKEDEESKLFMLWIKYSHQFKYIWKTENFGMKKISLLVMCMKTNGQKLLSRMM